MITQQQAEQFVYEHINAPDTYWPDRPEMIVTHMEERAFGWVAYWTSRPWHETGDTQHAIAGNGPILVCREDGTLFQAGTAAPLEERIREAERRLQAYRKNLSPHDDATEG